MPETTHKIRFQYNMYLQYKLTKLFFSNNRQQLNTGTKWTKSHSSCKHFVLQIESKKVWKLIYDSTALKTLFCSLTFVCISAISILVSKNVNIVNF